MFSLRLNRYTFVALLACAAGGPSVWAKPYVESIGRLEVDWATHKIRFFGESRLPENAPNDQTYRSVEKAAWQDGLNYVYGAVRDYHLASFETEVADLERLKKDAAEAARAITTSTVSRKTIYYGDGTVRVLLENQLPKVLASPHLRFRQKEAMLPSATRYSGIVFKLDRATKPKAIYQVVDETGALLFDEADMAEQAYDAHLMGRWYIKPTASELAQAVGKSPLEVPAKVDDKGRFVVSRSDWQGAVAGYRPLLVGGRIAISLPHSL